MELRLDAATARIADEQRRRHDPLCAYLYDLASLDRHASGIVGSLPPGCDLFYAVKANCDVPILETLSRHVAGFEVSSGGELAWIRRSFSSAPVIFSGPGKTDGELADALRQGIDTLHVESLHELHRLALAARASGRIAPVLLRVNPVLDRLPATTLVMGGRPTPFGIDVELLPVCLDFLARSPELRLRGFHLHLLSHQLDAAAHARLVEAYLDLADGWCDAFGLRIDQLNVGGGIGVNYRDPDRQFDWTVFSAALGALLRARRQAPRIRFEIGRFLAAACGCYATEVLDVKRTHGRHFVVVRGGTHHFRTPYAQGHSHPFHVLPVEPWPHPFPRPAVHGQPVTVVGQLCTPKDVLAYDVQVPAVRVGDILVFRYAGAYAWHISHHDFLRHPHPDHWYLPVEDLHHAAVE